MKRRNFILNIGLLSGGIALIPSLVIGGDNSRVKHGLLQTSQEWLEVNELKVKSILRFFQNEHTPNDKDIFHLNVEIENDKHTVIFADKEVLNYSEKIKILDRNGIISDNNCLVHLISGEGDVNGTLLTENQFVYLNKGPQSIKLNSKNSCIVLVNC